MERQFFPYGGFGFHPFFRPFFNPFFPRRFLFPFFSISPFFFPFRGDENANEMCYAHHQAQEGESLESLSHVYNMPHPILEEANPHIGNPTQLRAGETVVIPRISNLQTQKTYMESEMPNSVAPAQAHKQQAMM